jgi:hypothetical protein
MGRVAVREPIALRSVTSEQNFTQNLLRRVAEDRLNLAVERPSPICWVKHGCNNAAVVQ